MDDNDLVKRARQLRMQVLVSLHDEDDSAIKTANGILEVWAEAVACANRNTFLEIQAEIGALDLALTQMGYEIRPRTSLLGVVTDLGDAIATRHPEWVVEEVWDLLEADTKVPRWKWVLDWLDHRPGVDEEGLYDRVRECTERIKDIVVPEHIVQCVGKTLSVLRQYGMVFEKGDGYDLTPLGRKLAIRCSHRYRTTPVTPLEK